MQKEKNFKFLIVILIFAFFILIFHSVSAYYLLESLPQAGGALKEATLSTYLSWLFRFALAAAAFLAVLQITIGGIQMIFGGASETARTNAKNRISDAIWGLVLALGSVLILTTVSAQFKDMKLDIPPITVEGTKAPTGIGGEYDCMITIIGKEKDPPIKSMGWPYKSDPEWKSDSKEAALNYCKEFCKGVEGRTTAECKLTVF